MFGATFTVAIVLLGIGISKFWRQTSKVIHGKVEKPDLIQATQNVLMLKYLDGGHGKGCNEQDDRYTQIRRVFHHLTFYGFMLCFAATGVATLYHYFLNLHAPYPIFSLPVILGTLGGFGLVIGPSGLLYLNLKRHPLHGDREQKPVDRGFIFLLLIVSVSGLALMAFRNTPYMALLLIFHLATVMTFFITMPFGKFAHGFTAVLLYSNLPSKNVFLKVIISFKSIHYLSVVNTFIILRSKYFIPCLLLLFKIPKPYTGHFVLALILLISIATKTKDTAPTKTGKIKKLHW